MRPGDTIPLGKKTLQVIRVRDDDADQPPVLVVEAQRLSALPHHAKGGGAPRRDKGILRARLRL
jgi:hypothetical protein